MVIDLLLALFQALLVILMINFMLISSYLSCLMIICIKTLCSCSSILTFPDKDFLDQTITSYEGTFSFDDNGTESLKTVGTFPASIIFNSFDVKAKLDFVSFTWFYFPEYTFSLGLKYPFFVIVFDFFEVKKNLLIFKLCL